MEKINIFLDTSFFVPPNSQKGFLQYVLESKHCYDNIDEEKFSHYISEMCFNSLSCENEYPSYDLLKNLISCYGLARELQANDVYAIIDSIFRKAKFAENEMNGDEVEVVKFESLCDGKKYCDDLRRILLIIYLLSRQKKLDEKKQLVVSRIVEGSKEYSVEKETLIFMRDNHQLSNSRKLLFNILEKYSQIVDEIDSTDIWIDLEKYDLAIEFNLQQAKNQGAHLLEWRLGIEFITYVCKENFDSDKTKVIKLIRALSETIINSNLQAVHAVRTKKGGNAPQRTRNKDNAMLFRRDIDRDFHLHYWKCPDGKIEFASINHHDDLSIPE